MNAPAQLLLELADDELILGWRNSEWTGIAPFLEEDVAFSSIAVIWSRGTTQSATDSPRRA